MQHASRSRADWLGRLSSLDIPVLRATRKALQKAWQQPDRVDANFLAEIILRDPLMTLRILAYASVNRSPRVVTPAETVCAAVLLMGINSFQRSFSELSVLEESLAGHRDALHHVRGLCRRARRAGRFALGLAAQRHDPNAALIYEAALIHDVAEMLLWIRFPEKGRELHRHEATHKMGAEVSQRELLGQTFTELGKALLTHWQMPSPLVRMAEDAGASESIVRSAQLAIRFARHTESGWSHPDVLTDLKDLSGLLGLSMTATRELMAEIEL